MSTNLWERAKEALGDLCEYQPEAAELLAEMERVECVEGKCARVSTWDETGMYRDDPYDWEFSTNTTGASRERSALLLLLPTTEAPHD